MTVGHLASSDVSQDRILVTELVLFPALLLGLANTSKHSRTLSLVSQPPVSGS